MPRQPPFDGALLDSFPGVLALPLHEFAAANLDELRLHRLCDAIEILTRFCTVLAVAEARLPADPRKLPDQLVKELGPNILTPTFARWLGMAKGLADFLAGERSNPMVLPGLPGFIRDVLLKTAPHDNRYLESSILELRNTLAHGGRLTGAMAEYLLLGDASGHFQGLLSSVPAELAAEEDEAPWRPAEGGLASGGPPFRGWETVLGEVVTGLAALLGGSRLCLFGGEAARDLTGLQPSGGVVPLSADLILTLRPLQLQGHVLLLRDGRWLDLWPLCDHGKARLMSLRGQIESEGEAPLLYYRGEPQRLLYAAFGTTPPVGERGDAVAEFQALFRPDQRKEKGAEVALDFSEELRRDSLQLVGRAAEEQHVKDVVNQTQSGVLWLSGTGGIGKSFLMARVAVNHCNDPRRWCRIPWRFRVSDADRSNANTFLRYALTRLAGWPVLGRAGVRPDLDSKKWLAQLDELLRAAGSLPPGKDGKPPRVLFVLDGMDEAARLSPDLLEWPFRFAPPNVTYPNVVWLCAGRSGEATDKTYAPDRCTHLFPGGLPPMSAGDLRAMLYRELGETKYPLLGLDLRDASGNVTNPLVDAILARSEGLPLYIHFLVEDLLTGRFQSGPDLIGQLPRGLVAYYDDLLRSLGLGALQALLTPLVASVVWAGGPLAEEVLLELMFRRKVIRRREAEQARARLREGLQAVAAMLRVAPLAGGGLGYEPYHLTFREHFRRDEAARVGDQNDLARDEFCELTRDWAELQPHEPARLYVFRHGPQHLLDEKRREDLYALARDKAFLRAQAEELPAEPEAPLRALRAALTAAGRCEDAADMAEFLLSHAERTHGLQSESPLTALRRGNRERARRLADLADPERSVLFHLLLAWELLDSDRVEEARHDLGELTQRNLPRLSLQTFQGVEHGAAAVAILAPLSRYLPETVADLAARILEEKALAQLAAALSPEGLLPLTRSVTGVLPRSGLLGKLATAQAGAGHVEAARLTFEEALRSARAIDHSPFRANALRDIAAAQALAGQGEMARLTFEEALQAARAIDHPSDRDRALALRDVGAAQARAGQVEAARLTFEEALRTARAVDDLASRALAVRDIAVAQAEAGQTEEALQTARSLDQPTTRADALRDIAAARARAGQMEAARLTFEEALQTARTIDRLPLRALALQLTATAQAKAGQTEEARQTARALDDAHLRCTALRDIAAAQARAGQGEAARLTFEQAIQAARAGDNPSLQAGRLQIIAMFQAVAGQTEAALQTAGALESSSYYRSSALQVIAMAQAGQEGTARPTFERALQTARAVDDPSLQAAALRAIAAARVRAGQMEAARLTFEQSLQTARATDHPPGRALALQLIATAQAKAGRGDLALRTARAIDDPSLRANGLRDVAAAPGARQTPTALLTFEEAIQAARAIGDPSKRDIALRDIATARAHAGQTEAALQTARDIADPSSRTAALAGIAAARAQAGDPENAGRAFEHARNTARAIDFAFSRASALRAIATARARAGQEEMARLAFEEAIQTAHADSNSYVRAMTLRDIAAAQAEVGQTEAALQTARPLSDPFLRAMALRDVAAAQAEVGQEEAARLTIEWALEAARAIDDLTSRANALRDIAAACGCVSQLAAVQEVIRSSKAPFGENKGAEFLQAFACVQAKAHLLDKALATADLILVDREKHLPAIIDRFLQTNDRTAFKELLIPCAAHLESAWKVCGLLARAYPDQASAIAEVALHVAREPG
jgi:hypothetical protein